MLLSIRIYQMAGAEFGRPLPSNHQELLAAFSHKTIDPDKFVIMSGNGNLPLTQRVQEFLGPDISITYPCGRFLDSDEIKVRIVPPLRNRHAAIIQSLSRQTSNMILEVAFMADAAKHSAARISAITPYFAYAREDKKLQGAQMPISVGTVAGIFAGTGVNDIFTLDLHSDQSQVAVEGWTVAYACKVLGPHLKDIGLGNAVVLSPDEGGLKRASRFARRLNGNDHDLAIIHKRRDPNDPMKSVPIGFEGDVKGKSVIVYDDMIATGGTLRNAGERAIENGAVEVFAAAPHGLFAPREDGRTLLDDILKPGFPIKKIFTTDTTDQSQREDFKRAVEAEKLEVISVAPIIAVALLCYLLGESVEEHVIWEEKVAVL